MQSAPHRQKRAAPSTHKIAPGFMHLALPLIIEASSPQWRITEPNNRFMAMTLTLVVPDAVNINDDIQEMDPSMVAMAPEPRAAHAPSSGKIQAEEETAIERKES